MLSKKHQQVFVYYDEIKKIPNTNLQGHILFFIPQKLSMVNETPLLGKNDTTYHPNEMLFTKIIELRQKYSCDRKFHFSKLSGTRFVYEEKIYEELICVLLDSLRQKRSEYFEYPLNCKVAVIYFPEKTNFNYFGSNNKIEKDIRNTETFFRILLKGAAHFLYDENNTVEISKIIIDGSPAQRPFDKKRVIHQLWAEGKSGRAPLRDYVTISTTSRIIHLDSNHKVHQTDSDQYINSNLLQAADLILGGISRCYSQWNSTCDTNKKGTPSPKKDHIASIIQCILNKTGRKYGFRNSGYYKSFAISKVSFSDQGLVFEELHSKIRCTKQILDHQIEIPFDN